MFVSPSPAALLGTTPFRLLTLVFLGLAALLDASPFPDDIEDAICCCDAGRPLGILFGGGIAMLACEAVLGMPPAREVVEGFRDISLSFVCEMARFDGVQGEEGKVKTVASALVC